METHRFNIAIILVMLSHQLLAQCLPVENINVRTSPTSTSLSWEQPNGVHFQNIDYQAEMITHYGIGHDGGNVSQLQDGLSIGGINGNNSSGFKVADDFGLMNETYISEIEFYCFRNGPDKINNIDEVYIQIYDASPAEDGKVIWESFDNVPVKTEWTNIYRVPANLLYNNPYRPIIKVTMDIGVVLEQGNYWFTLSYDSKGLSSEYAATFRTALGEYYTGNCMSFNGSIWRNIVDNGYPQGLAFNIRGVDLSYGTAEIGYNVYRDGLKLNNAMFTDTHFTDINLCQSTEYNYSIEVVYSDGCTAISDNIHITTKEVLPVNNLICSTDGNAAILQWERPAVLNGNTEISYNIYLGETLLTNTSSTSYTRDYLSNGDYEFCVSAVYEDGLESEKVCANISVDECFPPHHLTADVSDFDVRLQWEAPVDELEIISMSKKYNGYILTTQTNYWCEWEIAHRYVQADLEPYRGMALTKVAFVPGDPNNIYSIHIYVNDNQFGPGEPIVNQAVDNFIAGEINVVWLENPVVIDPSQKLWIGINCIQRNSGAVLGFDDGPAYQLKGNLIFCGYALGYGWGFHSQNGYIDAYVGDGFNDMKLEYGSQMPDNEFVPAFTSLPEYVAANTSFIKDENYVDTLSQMSQRSTKYNVYRDGVLVASEISEMNYSDNNLYPETYTYSVVAVEDNCISMPVERVVTISVDGIAEEFSQFEVFPNPGSDKIIIRTAVADVSLEFFDINGRLVAKQNVFERETVINTEDWKSGTYIWKVYYDGKIVESGKWMK